MQTSRKWLNIFLKPFMDLLLIVGPIYIATLAIRFMEKVAMANYHSRFGDIGIKLTSFIGTPFHELSHAVMALIFGHKINKIQWFNFNMYGVQGYVSHHYNPGNLYQVIGNFFIGFAPIILGSLFIMLSFRLLMKESFLELKNELVQSIDDFTVKRFFRIFASVLKAVFSFRIKSIKYWIFVILTLNIAFHMGPSAADLSGTWKGGIALFIVLFMIRLIPIEKFSKAFSRGMAIFERMLIVTLSISLIFCAINLAISSVVALRIFS